MDYGTTGRASTWAKLRPESDHDPNLEPYR
jgi:hypothetical protein